MGFYSIRIFKSWAVRDLDRRWVNSYEVEAPTISDPGLMEPVMRDFVAAEQQLHLGDVQFLSATISTWAADSRPYDPASFFTYDLTVTGLRGAGFGPSVSALDSNVCFLVKKQTYGGKDGKLFYRGCLKEEDVHIGGDARFALDVSSDLNVGGARWLAYLASMDPHLVAGPDAAAGTLSLISMIAAVRVSRPVVAMQIGQITVNRRNHRYFDRAGVR